MSFFWAQKTGGEDAWQLFPADQRQKVIADIQPAFVTVLNAFSVPEAGWGREEFAAMKYMGPLYFDWDASDVEDTINEFKIFLVKLQEDYNVKLSTLGLYATGGRGFHLEVPIETLLSKVPRTGLPALPYIFKEMAFELVTDHMDMRVYTGRRGRMWRTPNVERVKEGERTGRFKVPITVEEAMAMTPESYIELTSERRPEVDRSPPQQAMGLSALYQKCAEKIVAAVKKSAKAGNAAELLLMGKFKGEWPPSLIEVMNGKTGPGLGFQKIAFQLGIAANALGKTSEELVEACAGLIDSHESDGDRYGSKRKRREELARMWDYMHDNPCYAFSVGGIRSLMEPGADSSDLETVDRSLDGMVVIGDEVPVLTAEQEAEFTLAEKGHSGGIIIHPRGIFVRTGEGLKSLSHVSFTNPTRRLSAEDRLHIGFEVDVLVGGKKHSRGPLPMETFKSRAQMHQQLSGYGGTFMGNDIQAGIILTSLDSAAKSAGREVYIVHREGLDIVQNPTILDKVSDDVVWASPAAVLCGNSDVQYSFQPRVSTEPVFRTDIHLVHPLEDTPETLEFMRNLLNINAPIVVAQMLGWFVSCLHKQFYQRAYNQFPLLHPNGQAGSGKTLTTLLMGRLWHNATKVQLMSCSESASTNFSIKAAWTGSASIPLVLDEYKPVELGQRRTDFLTQLFRLAYNQGTGASGGMSRGGANSTFRDVTQYAYSAPVVYLAESQEMQTAIVQRSLPVAFTSAKDKHTEHFEAATAGADYMPQLGAALLRKGMAETVESRREALAPVIADLRRALPRHVHDRQVYNLAIVVAGLDFLKETLQIIFGDRLNGDVERLRNAVYEQKADIAVIAINEVAKVLNDFAHMSHTLDSESEWALREGKEYIVLDGYIEIMLKESYIKYLGWMSRTHQRPLFTSPDHFIVALSKFDAVSDRLCLNSVLKQSRPAAKVFRMDLKKLVSEGVEEFASRARS